MASPDRRSGALGGAGPSLERERVLVTGASGFIGANLVRSLLAGGAEVHALLRPASAPWRLDGVLGRVRVHSAALTDRGALERAFTEARPAVVFHLATPRGHDEPDRIRLLEETIVGAAHLLSLVREVGGCRLVVAGSSLEYGPSDAAHHEAAPLWPTTVHGVAKAAVSLLCRQDAIAHGTAVCVLRIFHAYGPWEHPDKFFPRALRAALDGQLLPLTEPGIRRDWVFVDDVIDAMLRAASRDLPGEWLNIGSGEELSNEGVLASIAAVTGREVRTAAGEYPRGPADAAHRRADWSRARAVLGWAPRHDLAAGVQRTLEWLRLNPDAWSRASGGKPSVL